MFVKATRTERLIWNFQCYIQVQVPIKCISQHFDIGDLRSGQFCDLAIISQWEKIEKRLFLAKTVLNTLKHRITEHIGTLNRIITTCDPFPSPKNHFRSRKVTGIFSAITFDRDSLKRWKHLRCVRNDDTDRLICHMNFSDQVMTFILTLTNIKFSTWPFKVK